MSLTILSGMPQEHEIALRVFPGAQCLSGTDKLNLDKLVSNTCTRLVSFGLCGGLKKGVPVGAILIANSLVTDMGANNHLLIDSQLVERLSYVAKASGMNFHTASWYSSGKMDEADTVPQRSHIFQQSGAWAIDDESFYAAAYATNHQIELGIVRSVSDDSSETLPLAATGAILNKDGSVDLNYLLRALVTEPFGQTLDLFRVAKDFVYSLQTLEYAGKVFSTTLLHT